MELGEPIARLIHMSIDFNARRYSGLSFACFAKEVVKLSKGECGVLAFDARRHGMFVNLPRKSVIYTFCLFRKDYAAVRSRRL